jgi:hypothetical protein
MRSRNSPRVIIEHQIDDIIVIATAEGMGECEGLPLVNNLPTAAVIGPGEAIIAPYLVVEYIDVASIEIAVPRKKCAQPAGSRRLLKYSLYSGRMESDSMVLKERCSFRR